MRSFTIAELEILTGIKSYTIRIWEKRHSLLKPARSEANIRSYNIEQVEELLNISLLNKHGYKISGLALLNKDEVRNRITNLNSAEAAYDKALKDLLLCLFKMNPEDFEFILDSCTASIGSDKIITNIILPFLDRIRPFWNRVSINPIQDHFISLIRCKLYAGIESLSNTLIRQKICLLFHPAGQPHELELLSNHYLFKKAGYKIICLAGNTSVENAKFAAISRRPNVVITHVSPKTPKKPVTDLLQHLALELPGSTFIVQGNRLNDTSDNIRTVEHSIQLMKFVDTLD